MKKTFPLVSLAIFFFSATLAKADNTYKIDPGHCSIVFNTEHLKVGRAWGRFNDFSGQMKVDPADPGKSSIQFSVKSNSVDTNNEARDKHLKGPDFFDAKQFPEITFSSNKVTKKDDKNFEITGTLTMLGESKEVTAQFAYAGLGTHPRGNKEILGGEATIKVKRSDFGMKYGIPNIGD
ncbi:MAG: YceI family protein, partial [Verrucomicrobiota bacterium]